MSSLNITFGSGLLAFVINDSNPAMRVMGLWAVGTAIQLVVELSFRLIGKLFDAIGARPNLSKRMFPLLFPFGQEVYKTRGDWTILVPQYNTKDLVVAALGLSAMAVFAFTIS